MFMFSGHMFMFSGHMFFGHMCRVDMDRFEHVVAMKVLALRSQEMMSGRKEFIVIGSTSVCGEDVQCKGKVCRLFIHLLVSLSANAQENYSSGTSISRGGWGVV